MVLDRESKIFISTTSFLLEYLNLIPAFIVKFALHMSIHTFWLRFYVIQLGIDSTIKECALLLSDF